MGALRVCFTWNCRIIRVMNGYGTAASGKAVVRIGLTFCAHHSPWFPGRFPDYLTLVTLAYVRIAMAIRLDHGICLNNDLSFRT
jgi:hypothetical protein